MRNQKLNIIENFFDLIFLKNKKEMILLRGKINTQKTEEEFGLDN